MIQTNAKVIFIIITSLASMAVLCVLTICVLSYFSIQISPELNTLTAALVGALSAMLVKTSPTETAKTHQGQVHVVNPPNEPVPTVEAKKIRKK